jgi:hypothetical protein
MDSGLIGDGRLLLWGIIFTIIWYGIETIREKGGAMTSQNKCDCEYHKCANQDDYTEDGSTCEQCFTDCVIMEGEI